MILIQTKKKKALIKRQMQVIGLVNRKAAKKI
jgi:hypothetical protein